MRKVLHDHPVLSVCRSEQKEAAQGTKVTGRVCAVIGILGLCGEAFVVQSLTQRHKERANRTERVCGLTMFGLLTKLTPSDMWRFAGLWGLPNPPIKIRSPNDFPPRGLRICSSG